VTAPSYSEYIASIRKDGEAILAAARFGVDESVPTCGDWTVGKLLIHLGRVYNRASTVVSERLTTQLDFPPEPPDGTDAIAYVADALDDLVAALTSAAADTPVWNRFPEPQTASFWARRMAHESAVHRYDAQLAHGVAQPIDADFARDGLDEMIDVLLPFVVTRDEVKLPEATYVFATTDDGSWTVRLGVDGVQQLDVAKEPDVTVRGTPSALLLAAYNRVRWTSLEVDGDIALLEQWSDLLKF
jgi:uncharacterized protein (TIGR03083 family)